MTQFQGFPDEAMIFFTEIAHNNNKEWFEAQKPNFKKYVQTSAQNFVLALGERIQTIVPNIQYDTKLNGSGSVMRIYRDVRFSKDKTPYKTNLGIAWWEGTGKKMEEPGYFFHLDREGAWFAGGMYAFPKSVIEPYRLAVDHKVQGTKLAGIVSQVEATGPKVTAIGEYARVPRGFDKEHPRADLLKMKGLVAVSPAIPASVVTSPELIDVCFEYAKTILPLHQWLVKMCAG